MIASCFLFNRPHILALNFIFKNALLYWSYLFANISLLFLREGSFLCGEEETFKISIFGLASVFKFKDDTILLFFTSILKYLTMLQYIIIIEEARLNFNIYVMSLCT